MSIDTGKGVGVGDAGEERSNIYRKEIYMGHRTVKRVPLDFLWSLNQVWKGYINPYRAYINCKSCEGSGYNMETKMLSDDWYTHLRTDGKRGWGENLEQEDVQALIDKGRLFDFTRRPLNEEHRRIIKERMEKGENSWLPFDNGYVPTADEVNQWNKRGFGHDSINHWICVEARAKRLGIWGYCEFCGGDGEIPVSDELVKLHEDWKKYEPPKGEGYQLWETCSEGSPISPVFASADELAKWAAEHATIFGHEKLNYEEWLVLINNQDVEGGSMMVKVGDYIGPLARLTKPD